MSREIWRAIPGYEGKYEASTRGRIRSLSRKVKHPTGSLKNWKGRILALSVPKRTGYQFVQLGDNSHTFLVHRLVALTFIPNPQSKPCVNHKDGDRLNNSVRNLEWMTYQENEQYSYDVLGKIVWNKGRKGKQKNHNTDGLALGRLGLNFLPKKQRDRLIRTPAAQQLSLV